MLVQHYRDLGRREEEQVSGLRWTIIGLVVLLLWCGAAALGVFVVGLLWFSGAS
ncbi:hypothetical protein [Teichococcus vastitatis]|jgi:hypothetical protein|uniref:Uncharacterized protein n=1 Tax=Teichococcus vastitatis TaxID=2307076 RepID=A0ABS9W7A1_9PROT|nr:hypothetical protein [Pseudoroseomonas vastitatis]MCI0755182.1 hypothetical protein [Pseudoroseomonas vastitatis]